MKFWGKTPNKIIRWGVSVLFLIIVVLLIGSWFFKYPDTIVSTIELTTHRPPSDVIAKATGKFDTIYVKNNGLVTDGEVLAIIENPASFPDVRLLSGISKVPIIQLI